MDGRRDGWEQWPCGLASCGANDGTVLSLTVCCSKCETALEAPLAQVVTSGASK